MFKKLFPILLLTFVNIIGFTLLVPVFPEIVERYAPPELAGFMYGALLSSYALFQFLASPLLGALSDHFGRKPLLYLSQLGTLISWVIFAVAYFVPEWQLFGATLPLYVIALSRIVDGITGGNVSVANAWVSDITQRDEKVQAFGLIGATFGVGFLVGPALGGLTSASSYGYLGTCIVAFCISLVTLLIIKYYLPESLPKEKRDPTVDLHLGRQLNMYKKFTAFKENSFVSRLLVIKLSFTLAFSGYVTIIILYLRSAFGLSTAELGITLSLIGLFSIFNQAVVVKKVVGVFGEVRTLYGGLLLVVFGMFVLPIIPTELPPIALPLGFLSQYSLSFLLVMTNAFLMNLGISLSGPSFKSLFVNAVDDTKQGAITGLDESLAALGNAITPMLAGTIFVVFGVQAFAVFALLLASPLLYYFVVTGAVLPSKHLARA